MVFWRISVPVSGYSGCFIFLRLLSLELFLFRLFQEFFHCVYLTSSKVVNHVRWLFGFLRFCFSLSASASAGRWLLGTRCNSLGVKGEVGNYHHRYYVAFAPIDTILLYLFVTKSWRI
jgi:hypothetical protein